MRFHCICLLVLVVTHLATDTALGKATSRKKFAKKTDTSTQEDEEGMNMEKQMESYIIEEGAETHVEGDHSSGTDDHNTEAFIQNSQDNLQDKDSDSDMEDRIMEYVDEHDNITNSDGIHISDIQGDINVTEVDDKTRSAMYSNVRTWDHGIVPYDFETGAKAESAEAKVKIVSELGYIESISCVRFVPWTANTKAQYKLTHDTRLWFIHASGCWSFVGRLNVEKQQISTCSGGATLHEMGHALGSPHEQVRTDSPHYLQVNWENIKPDHVDEYKLESTNNLVPYDLGSIMHYGDYTFSTGSKPTMTIFDSDLKFLLGKRSSRMSFYDIKALNLAYKCVERKCPGVKLNCQNMGFIGYINGECKCVCPDGLTGKTCGEIFKPHVTSKFPGGRYALHKSKEGCPGNSFSSGSRLESQVYSGYGKRISDLRLPDGADGSRYFRYDFCVADVTGADWPPGTYCIYRSGGTCPKGFKSGSKLFDDANDATRNKNNVNGAVPDGVFNSNTKLYYCCRNDGAISEPIDLPSSAPFQLLNGYTTTLCQQVQGMGVLRGQYYISTEKTLDKFVPPHPMFGTRWYTKYNLHGLYFCHYSPIKYDCGGIIDLTKTTTVSSPLATGSSNYSNGIECRWLIKSPPSSAIKIKFSKFDVRAKSGGCEDFLEIRHHTIASPGARYCGDRFERSLVSNGNYMMLVLRTDTQGTAAGFKATLSVVTQKDYNYKLSNGGLSYAGNVRYTQQYQKCLAWDKVTHCNYHLFRDPHESNVLGGHNKCRNPSEAELPWCYIDADCNVDYCDVAGLDECYDKFGNCSAMAAAKPNYYASDEGFEMCHKSAGKCGQDVVPSAGKCGAAPSTPLATVTSTVKSQYDEGDIVTYGCKSGFGEHSRICLNDGSWSEDTNLCLACPRGWLEARPGVCYFASTEKKPYWSARTACQDFGGDFIIVKDKAEDDVLTRILKSTGSTSKYYIGANDAAKEGVYKWVDGSTVTLNHFAVNPQSIKGYDSWDCVRAYMKGTGTGATQDWNQTKCSWSNKYICRVPLLGKVCDDSRSDCAFLVSRTANMCKSYPEFAAIRCKRTCGFCPAGSNGIN